MATLKISRQVAAAKPAALTAANSVAFQFKTDRNIASLISQNATVGKPVFHFQRRLDENQFELEEIEDSVNVRDRKVSPQEDRDTKQCTTKFALGLHAKKVRFLEWINVSFSHRS